MPLTLISATPSAYARINRIALMEKGIPFELKNEVPWNKDTETPTYNPLEKLPILIFEDGSAMYDSLLIQEWIIVKHADKEPSLLPAGQDAGFIARQIQTLSNGHMDAMALLFFEKNRNEPSREWTARQMRKIDGSMRAYSEYVKAAKGDWLVGDTYTIADISVGCAIEWVDFFGLCEGWKEQYPELAAWWDKLKMREAFKETVPVMFEMKEPVVGGKII